MKNYYERLGVARSASPEEIKHAFRREIARYHPDKLEHLGAEFRDLAAVRAGELTEAYHVLQNESLRAMYDEQFHGDETTLAPDAPSAGTAPSTAEQDGRSPGPPPPEPTGDFAFGAERARRDDVVRRAMFARFRSAVEGGLVNVESLPGRGFDAAYASRPKRGLFRKLAVPMCVCGRFVARVDAAVVEESWSMAMKLGSYEQICVFLVGSEVASPRELAHAISERRRKTPRLNIVIVPVDARDWEALVPAGAPAEVKRILEKLRHI